jgi:hypothetical protein
VQNYPTRLGSLLCASYYRDGHVYSNYLVDPEVDRGYKLLYFCGRSMWRNIRPYRTTRVLSFSGAIRTWKRCL